MSVLLFLAQLIGIKGIVKGARWAMVLAVRLAMLAVLGALLYEGRSRLTGIAVAIALLLVLWSAFRWWRNREPETPVERTIDGKVVPEKLAAAALDVPPRSPMVTRCCAGFPITARCC